MPGADRADDAFVAPAPQRGIRLVDRLVHVVVGIVDVDDVDAVETEPLEAASSERCTPSAEKSNTGCTSGVSSKIDASCAAPGSFGTSSRPTLVAMRNDRAVDGRQHRDRAGVSESPSP